MTDSKEGGGGPFDSVIHHALSTIVTFVFFVIFAGLLERATSQERCDDVELSITQAVAAPEACSDSSAPSLDLCVAGCLFLEL